jgi:hypothetical protein
LIRGSVFSLSDKWACVVNDKVTWACKGACMRVL